MAIIYNEGFSHFSSRRAAPPSVRALKNFPRNLITFLRLLIFSLWIFSITAKNNQPGPMRRNASGNFSPSERAAHADGENIALFNGPARSTDVHLSQNVLSVIESYLHASG